MSVTRDDKDNLNDQDLAEIFANDKLAPPAALDADILQQARAAHHSDANSVPKQSSLNKIAPMFATAAVFLLAVVLVPLMVGQDDVAQDSTYAPTAAGSNNKPDDDRSYSEAIVLSGVQSDSVTIVLQANEGDAADAGSRPAENVGSQFSRPAAQSRLAAPQAETMAEESAPKLSARAVAEHPDRKMSDERQKKQLDSLSDDRELATSSFNETDDAPYRQTPVKWIVEIIRLFDNKKTDSARAELERFNAQHPNSDLLERLPPALLTDTAK